MPPLSIGIIGAGDLTDKVHLPVLLNLERRATVAWIADVREATARQVASSYRIPCVPLPSSLDNLPPADIVLLGIPYGVRRPYYDALRKRACAVYVEKPFARTVAELEEYCSGFAPERLACGFQRRSWGPVRLIKEALASGLFGRLISARFSLGCRGRINASGHHANIQQVGGGILFEVGIHGVDALLYASGAVEAGVEKASMVMDGPFDIHTDARLWLRTGRGERVGAQLTVTCLEDTAERLEFDCDNATLSLALFGTGDVELRPHGRSDATQLLSCLRTAMYPLTAAQTTAAHWQRFLDAIELREVNDTSAIETRLTAKIIEELYQEGSSSQAVDQTERQTCLQP